jgi:hypothetical protein
VGLTHDRPLAVDVARAGARLTDDGPFPHRKDM